MSNPEHLCPPIFAAADQEVASYRAVSTLSLAGLLAGLLSPLAMLSSVLWLAPLTAVVLSGLALRRIAARSPELVGRAGALAGLWLGVAFLVAAPVEDAVYRYCIRRQARQFAEIWIDAVRHGEVYKAHHLMIDPKHRLPLESHLADFYRKSGHYRKSLESFVSEPVMRTLFALGPAAEIRFYETASERRLEASEVEEQTYAATYLDEQKQRKTFFISLLMERSIDSSSGRAGWTLYRVDGGVRPGK